MLPETIGKVLLTDINEEMKSSYLDYAMSVIVGRALPDVRDGLKPVHRRILYAMHKQGLSPDKQHRKSANVVGYVMGNFHPHGDIAIYDSLVRMAQDFSSRYPLIDGHGNFGSIDGDPPAAMRYTEARMSSVATEMLADIEKETVDFTPNYDGRTEEPTILPGKIPNLMVNGSTGIAVGMATNIPPHNLREIIDGVIMIIDNPEVSIEELIGVVKGPDFPTGGIIMGRNGIREAYLTGRGTIKVRSQVSIETTKEGKNVIYVHEIPYEVKKARMIEKIAELVREKKIDGISDLRDESDRRGMSIVIELRRDANPNVVLNLLYKHTQMEESYGIIMLALVNGQPQVLNLKQILYHYLQHQVAVLTRRVRFDLNKAEERAHILEGLLVALDHIDAVIEIIRSSQTVEAARKTLIQRFSLSEKQAVAILDMRLARLTGLEREKINSEQEEMLKKIAYFREVLADEKKLLGIIKEDLSLIRNKYGDDRRTVITDEETGFEAEDLIPEEEVVITITNQGYIKRVPLHTYRSQKRGGRGINAMDTKEEDFLKHLFVANTHNYLLFFTNKGKVYRLKVYEVPEFQRQARGTAIVNLLQIEPKEKITAVIPVKDFIEGIYLFMTTVKGMVKKTDLKLFDTSRRGGIIAATLRDDDELVEVKLTNGNEEIIIGTRHGKTIRFHEGDVPPHGRMAGGVRGIRLRDGDFVVGMDKVCQGADVLTITQRGYGKRTPVKEYRLQSRGGYGITNIKKSQRNGEIVAVLIVSKEEEFMMISAEGIAIRLKAADVSTMGRYTQGVTCMRIGKGDRVVAVAKVVADNV